MTRPNKNRRNAAPVIDDRAIIDDADPDLNKGGDDDNEGDDGDDDDGDDDNNKSDLDVADLNKAMDALEGAGKAAAAGTSPRLAVLSAKMAKGERLSAAETDEMQQLLKGSDDDLDDPLNKGDLPGLDGGDASDFLDALVTKTAMAISAVKDEIKKSNTDAQAFNAQLAKGFVSLGRAVASIVNDVSLLKSENAALKEALGLVVEQPAAPKGSTRRNNDMNKGGNGGGKNVDLPPKRIADILDGMLMKGEFPQGVDGLVEISKFESTGIVRQDVMATVLQKAGVKLDDVDINGG